MKQTRNSLNHGLDGLKDYTDLNAMSDKKSVKSEKICDSDNDENSLNHGLDGLKDYTDYEW